MANENTEWMRGRCWDMAVALADMTGLPLMGLYADGTCHHAFVWDEARQVGIDARGELGLDRIRKGCAGQEMAPLTVHDIERRGGWLGRPLAEEEIEEAVAFIESDDVLCNVVDFYQSQTPSVAVP